MSDGGGGSGGGGAVMRASRPHVPTINELNEAFGEVIDKIQRRLNHLQKLVSEEIEEYLALDPAASKAERERRFAERIRYDAQLWLSFEDLSVDIECHGLCIGVGINERERKHVRFCQLYLPKSIQEFCRGGE